MPIDTQTPGDPGWWLKRLVTKMGEGSARHSTLNDYYDGTAAVPIAATKAVRQAYQRLMALSKTNFAELVVEAVRERMKPVGFQTGAEGDELGDKEAWRIWQANALDADSALVHRSKLAMADGYVIVGGVDEEIGAPLITPEDPREVIVESDPRHRRRARAALKVFSDDVEALDWAYLYLPGEVHKAARQTSRTGTVTWDESGWEWEGDVQKLPAPVVPVVRFANRADNFGRSKGEFEPHLSILDRINYGILNRLEIVTLQAFRQRAIKGIPTHDDQGNEIDYNDIFSADPGALWQLPATADMWESGQVDLGPIHTSSRDDVQDLAAVTRTPLFYLTPDAANGSAEGASLAREGLVFKTSDRIVAASECWERVMALAFLFAGDEQRARLGDMQTLWAPPERFSLAERYDAASKAQAAGVPWRSVMRDVLQFSPQEIDRMEAERATDAFLAPVSAPLVA